MQSSGGVADAPARRRGPAPGACSRDRRAARSAPACSPAAAATATRSASTWAAPPATSAWSRTARCGGPTRARSTGRVIQLPMVDVHTVGAGGGSIGWRDTGGALRVGPRSAGRRARAGLLRARRHRADGDRRQPAARLPRRRTRRLAGGVALDADAAERRGRRGSRGELGLDALETAEGIVRVANQEMVRALRVVTVERGVDPRRFALMPFGGAGPMHAAAIAAELGIERILCPRAGGVLSALGLLASERRRDTARTVMLGGEELTAERIAAEVAALRDAARRGLGGRAAGGRLRAALPRPGVRAAGRRRSRAPDPADLAERFAAEHERRYGYRDPDGEVELVNIRLAAGRARARAAAGRGAGRGRPRARAAPGAVRRRVAARRRSCAASRRPGRRPRARASSSCRRRPSCCRRAGGREVDDAGTIRGRRRAG